MRPQATRRCMKLTPLTARAASAFERFKRTVASSRKTRERRLRSARQRWPRRKMRTRCAVCNRLGHWVGDRECPKRLLPGWSLERRAWRPEQGESRRAKVRPITSPVPPATSTSAPWMMRRMLFCNMVAGQFDDSSGSEESEDGPGIVGAPRWTTSARIPASGGM